MLFAILFSILVLMFGIFTITQNPSCHCLSNTIFFSNFTKLFFNGFAKYIMPIIWLALAITAFRYYWSIDKFQSGMVLFEFFIKLLGAAFIAKIFSLIISCYVCPLICNNFIDWGEANDCVWSNIRAWLGTGG